ncbi:N-acetyltransferase [Brachybacterium sp. EF45031]|nr:N-acetyltransferase [Brachybacterium sillae]
MRILPGAEHHISALVAQREDAIRHSPGLWIEEVPPRPETVAWARELVEHGRVLVAEDTGTDPGTFLGAAWVGPLLPRSGYRHTLEDSVYVEAAARGRGVGRLLLEALVQHARHLGGHSMVALIEAGNGPSLRVHERCGFTRAGFLPEAGRKFGRWHDLVIMHRGL